MHEVVRRVTTAARRVVVSIPTRPRYIRHTRLAVEAALDSVDVPSRFTSDVALVVDELSTNAIEHGKDGRVWVVIHVEPSGEVALRVDNPGTIAGLPPVQSWSVPEPEASSGRGLGIVRTLAHDIAVSEVAGRLSIVTRMRPSDV